MTVLNADLDLLQPQQDNASIASLARTIGAAFAGDPLIQWLRPGAPPWSRNGPEQKWQYRRIQQFLVDGVVLRSPSVRNLMNLYPRDDGTVPKTSFEEVNELETESQDETDDAGIAVLLIPPRRHVTNQFQRFWLRCKLWLLNRIAAVDDHWSKDSRVESLMLAHDELVTKVKEAYQLEDLWYLEVVAVHPLLQGRGIGVHAMKWVLQMVQDEPMLLECTAWGNVKFYRKLGFEVFEEVDLVDNDIGEPDPSCKCWAMVHLSPKKQK